MSDVTPITLDLDISELEAEAGEEDATPKGKGLGLIPMVAAAVVAAGVAGGAAFVLTPGAGNSNSACIDDTAADESASDHSEDAQAAHGEDDDHAGEIEECVPEDHGENAGKKKKADKGHGGGGGHGGGAAAAEAVKPIGAVQHSEHATFLVLDPMVISIQPIGRSKHLKVSLVFETDDEGADIMIDNGFYIQDVLNTYLRSVDHTVLEDPASMSRLRAQILRRIRVIVPDASVTNVLITEFVLT